MKYFLRSEWVTGYKKYLSFIFSDDLFRMQWYMNTIAGILFESFRLLGAMAPLFNVMAYIDNNKGKTIHKFWH